jgi:transposase-like protein
MAKKNGKRVYLCRHCNKTWHEHYLAELCYKVDMDNLTKGKEEMNNGKNKTYSKR